MKNVTVAVDDDLHRKMRTQAASAGLSMSRYIARLVENDTHVAHDPDEDIRLRLEALQRVFDAPKLKISQNGKMPTAEERNARR